MHAAWPVVVPNAEVPAWHVDAICEHIQAAYDRELPRLLVTIQPGALKSTLFSVMGPAWRWTSHPQERIVSASYRDDLATRDTRKTRSLIVSPWYQARWGPLFDLTADENLKTRYSNDAGGYRVVTHVGGGTGERGSVLILDDPHNAAEINSPAALAHAREWWGDTWASRLNASKDDPGVKMVIGQRIHEGDVIGFILDGDPEGDRWHHLCLPARYESKHPFVYPDKVKLSSGRELPGDPRTEEGELLAPDYVDEDTLEELTSEMTALTEAAQYQQNPSPREGALLKRAHWRYYPREQSFYAERLVFGAEEAAALGHFDTIVHSWDTSLRDRAHSDHVAGGTWGARGADRYLLRLFHERAGLNATVEAMISFMEWSTELWPAAPQYVLVENAASGPDAIEEIRRRVNGVVSITAKGTKGTRAAAASPALEGGNCFLPGYPNPEMTGYDARTPTIVQEFVEECAKFLPEIAHQKDDQVDQWSQALNWLRGRGTKKATTGVSRARI